MRGRPRNQFAPLEERCRRWIWLDAAAEALSKKFGQKFTRFKTLRDLDKLCVFADLADKAFEQVREDAHDPLTITVMPADRKNQVPAKKMIDWVTEQTGDVARDVFDHCAWAFWAHNGLDIDGLKESPEAFVRRVFRERGVVLIHSGDSWRAQLLGLQWGDCFEPATDPAQWPRERHDPDARVRGPGVGLRPILAPAIIANPGRFASLDGLLALTLLIRAHRRGGRLDFAQQLIDFAREVIDAFLAARWGRNEELDDSFRLLMETRVLNSFPDMQASEEDIDNAWSTLRDDFKLKEPQRGRPRKGPRESARGRVERRWRRRAQVKALLIATRHYDPLRLTSLVGTQKPTARNVWLTENRPLINQALRAAQSESFFSPDKFVRKDEDGTLWHRVLAIPVESPYTFVPPGERDPSCKVDPLSKGVGYGGCDFCEYLKVIPWVVCPKPEDDLWDIFGKPSDIFLLDDPRGARHDPLVSDASRARS